MRKAFGLVILIVALSVLCAGYEQWHDGTSRFLSLANCKNLLPWIGLYGILALGQTLVIVTGGIDLSVGSVVGLVGIFTAVMIEKWAAVPAVLFLMLALAMTAGIGLGHGLLIAKARMQPFVVTLCGLFFYRGIARFIAEDKSQSFGAAFPWLRWFGDGNMLGLFGGPQPGQPLSLAAQWASVLAAPFLLMILLAVILAAFLHFSPPGRHLFALGANEESARFSGVRTDRLKILAYVLCSLISGFAGLLFALKIKSLGPASFGEFYELYAIAGAVLGGCSLRGGMGNVLGVVLGVALIMILRNLVNLLQISSQLEYVVIGGTILIGVFFDELLTRRKAARVG
jgi:ribose transport system permease protein